MKIVCSWCGADMGEKPGPDIEISHSICNTYAAIVMAQMVGADAVNIRPVEMELFPERKVLQ